METDKRLIIKELNGKYENVETESYYHENESTCHTMPIQMMSEDFEQTIADSMDILELVDTNCRHDSDSETTDEKSGSAGTGKCVRIVPPEKRERTASSSTDTSCGDDDADISVSPTPTNLLRYPEIGQPQNLLWRPLLLPFQERRRLSQCKEEDEELIESEKGQATSPTKTVTGPRHKFIVTKAEAIPRPEVEKLKNFTVKQNAATIHFPCSSSVTKRASVNSAFFSPNREFSPHLDKKFFDTSLIEIRSMNSMNDVSTSASISASSTSAIATAANTTTESADVIDGNVWVPRKDSTKTDKKDVS